MNAFFNDLTVRAKLTLLAVVIVALTAGLGLYGWVLLQGNQQKTVELQTGALRNADIVLAFQNGALSSVASLYRLTSTASTETDTAKIESLSKAGMAEFDKLQAGLPAVTAAMAASGLPQDQTRAFGELLKAYVKRGKDVADMVTGDAATASGMMTGTRQRYEAMDASLKTIAATLAERKQTTLTAISADMQNGQNVFAISLIIIVLTALALSYVLGKRIAGPLTAMTDILTGLADGNLDIAVPDDGRKDEVGKLASATAVLRDRLKAAEKAKLDQVQVIVSSIGTGLEALAKGDLTARVTADLHGPFTKLKENFNQAIARLQDTMMKVLQNTGEISTGAGEISQAADDLSRRTEQQAASLEQTSAALEEITATVKTTASNAREARTRATAAKTAAENGGKVVGTAVDAMAKIEQSSKKITDIIGVIDEIAFQTNLLALNAGVEAARAGDAGRGFAVVASEVRALAQRSSDAAKQIRGLITASGEQVGAGVKYVGETGHALKRIVDQIMEINSFVTEMAQAAEQQATGIQQVNAAVGQMDQVTQQNAAMVEQSTAASHNLATETHDLTQLIAFFDVGMAPSSRGETRLRDVA
jgi:methyl-accepting chemotaxis protein